MKNKYGGVDGKLYHSATLCIRKATPVPTERWEDSKSTKMKLPTTAGDLTPVGH